MDHLDDPYPKGESKAGHAFKVLVSFAHHHPTRLVAFWSGRLCELADRAAATGGHVLEHSLNVLEIAFHPILLNKITCDGLCVDARNDSVLAAAITCADDDGPAVPEDQDLLLRWEMEGCAEAHSDLTIPVRERPRYLAGLRRMVAHLSTASLPRLVAGALQRSRRSTHAHLIKLLAALATLTPASVPSTAHAHDERTLPWDICSPVSTLLPSRQLADFVRTACLESKHLELHAVALHFLQRAIVCPNPNAPEICENDDGNILAQDQAAAWYVEYCLGGTGVPVLCEKLQSTGDEVLRMALLLTYWLCMGGSDFVTRYLNPQGELGLAVARLKSAQKAAELAEMVQDIESTLRMEGHSEGSTPGLASSTSTGTQFVDSNEMYWDISPQDALGFAVKLKDGSRSVDAFIDFLEDVAEDKSRRDWIVEGEAIDKRCLQQKIAPLWRRKGANIAKAWAALTVQDREQHVMGICAHVLGKNPFVDTLEPLGCGTLVVSSLMGPSNGSATRIFEVLPQLIEHGLPAAHWWALDGQVRDALRKNTPSGPDGFSTAYPYILRFYASQARKQNLPGLAENLKEAYDLVWDSLYLKAWTQIISCLLFEVLHADDDEVVPPDEVVDVGNHVHLGLCDVCGRGTRKRCVCKEVYYCSKDCQRSGYKQHRKTCRAHRAAKASADKEAT